MNKNGFVISAKARIFILLFLILSIVGASVYFYQAYKIKQGEQGGASVTAAPGIRSVPGASQSSQQYVGDVNKRNILSAQEAKKKVRSSVPTPTRSTIQGAFTSFTQDDGKRDNSKKINTMNQNSCTLKSLQLARNAGVTANELICQGCTCPNLRQAGYTAADLKDIGYTAERLKQCGFSLAQLVAAGFSAKDLKDAGFSAAQLKAAGFSAAQLKAAGFSAKDLKDAGFSAAQLKAAGFSAKDLKDAGFSAAQLKAAGFSAKQLAAAGFSAKQLAAAGFSPQEIQAAEAALKDKKARCDVKTLAQERMQGMTAKQLRAQGCGLAALKAAGFTAKELKAAGFTAAQLKAAGFTAAQLKAAGFTAAQLKAAGFSAKQLKDAGFSATDLKAAGFNAAQLKAAGFSAAELKAAGFSAKDLRNAGFSAAQLKAAGFTPAQLRSAGYSAGDLLRAGFSPSEAGYSSSNCDVASLRKARLSGVSAKTLRAQGCGLSALKAAGFTAAQLKAAGFTAAQLKAAGFAAAQLKAAGFTAAQLKAAGFTAAQLKQVGFSDKQLAQADLMQSKTAQATDLSGLQDQLQGTASLPTVEDTSPQAQLAKLAKEQEKRMSQQELNNAVAQMQGAMSMQAGKILGTWQDVPSQSISVGAPDSSTAAGAGAGAANSAAKKPAGPIYKAGSIMFAVIDTSINSDERTPILATVVSGPLKDSKLIGQFTRAGVYSKKLEIKFSLMNNPHFPHTIPISFVAIDPGTARTALSGQVNNHYLVRYGSLFASSFLEGIGSGFQSAASTSTPIGDTGLYINIATPPNPTQAALIGLGKVGSKWGQNIGTLSNRPPTIKIAGGTGIGILITSDFQLPGPIVKAH